jgi:pimeloyl-ACP methyl ester carboxylesterase
LSGWQKARRAWAVLGGMALVGFLLWMALGYRASATARAALISDERVVASEEEGLWRFEPAAGRDRRSAGLLFFPGALVDARAYAPLLREIALGGHPALLLRVPWRGAFGSADRPALRGRARRLMEAERGIDAWVVAGHSRGAKVAAMLARDGAPRLAGLALIGTTHPRDFSLAGLEVPVLKIYGSRDGVAPPDSVLANRHLLPASTEWVRIEGGNHAQFGWYGFQPLDRFAAISRSEQQAQTLAAIRKLLAEVER